MPLPANAAGVVLLVELIPEGTRRELNRLFGCPVCLPAEINAAALDALRDAQCRQRLAGLAQRAEETTVAQERGERRRRVTERMMRRNGGGRLGSEV